MKTFSKLVAVFGFGLLFSLSVTHAVNQDFPVALSDPASVESDLSAEELEAHLNELEVMRKEYESMLPQEKEDMMMKKHLYNKKFRSDKSGHYKKAGWHKKGLVSIIFHKIIWAGLMIGFLFCASFAIRKGWEKGGE